ncbi:MAG TPA: hypothetical protein PKZ32_05940 [Candidatus Melainabacteria bacterium]|nr:hypothetical protein [Candidatus Melainabacteria bacterium]
MSKQTQIYRLRRPSSNHGRCRGSALLEVVTIAIAVLFPLLYLSLDVTAVLIGYLQSVHVAKDAARAAASHSSQAVAQEAADFRFKIVRPNAMVSNLQMIGFDFIPDKSVNVKALVDVKLPAPLPELSVVKLKAHALVPIFSSSVTL